MRARFLLISNRFAGIAHSRLVAESVAALRSAGAKVDHVEPDSVAQARKLAAFAAREQAVDAVIAAGGDGTIRQIACALIGTSMPLAVIPVGTGNVLAHEIGLRRTPQDVAAMILSGSTIRVTLPHANGEPFLLMASAGLDARIVSALDQQLKSHVGKAAYMAPVLNAIGGPVDALEVETDNVKRRARWAIVTNAAHYGGAFVLSPRKTIARPGLMAVLFKAQTRAELVSAMISIARGKLDERCREHRDVEMIHCTRVTVSSDGPVPTQIDGDLLGQTPLSVETTTDALQLVVPDGTPLR